MDFHTYLAVLRKNWWLILGCVLLGLAGAWFVNFRAVPVYQSSVTFYVSTPTDAAGGNAYQANQYALSKIESYTRLLTSDRLAQLLVDEGGLDLSPADVARRISASSDLNTVLLTATISDTSTDRCLAIAKSIATEFGPLIDQLDNRTSKDANGSTVKLNVVSGPSLNPAPVSPRVTLNYGLGLLAGLIVGVALAVLRALLDTTVRSVVALQGLTELPVLGAVPLESSGKKRTPILTADQMRSIRAESYRQIRTNLQFMDLENPIQVLVVASSVGGEGKSTTAVNLAIVTAETGRQVLLIDGDMRRPRISEYLGIERSVGLSNVLVGQVAVDDVLQSWGTDGLMILPCGSIPPNPSELLGSHQMADLLSDLRIKFDFIIIDTPPLLPVTDAAVTSATADGTIVVVRYGKTSRTQVSGALQSLETVDARTLGCVLSMMPKKGTDSGYDGYGYYTDVPVKSSRVDLGRFMSRGDKVDDPVSSVDQGAAQHR